MATAGGRCYLNDLEKMIRQTAEELAISDIRFIADPSAVAGKSLLLSSRGMQVILWELLENAKKFHPQLAPAVEVSLSCDQEGGAVAHAVLRISDNGLALPPKDIVNALKPYYQGEKSFSGEVTGMGLGLPTVAALVWQMGGGIDLYNRKDGPGLVVELRLPLA